jgi:hypothetical protein
MQGFEAVNRNCLPYELSPFCCSEESHYELVVDSDMIAGNVYFESIGTRNCIEHLAFGKVLLKATRTLRRNMV